MTFTYETMVNGLVSQLGIHRERAEVLARRHFHMPDAAVELRVVDERALEKVHEREGDRIMLALGFESLHFSQPRASKQTPGIADRRFYRRPRVVPRRDGMYHQPAIMFWWEVKSATGKQSADERAFQEMVEACGETYVLGTHEDLIAWLVGRCLATVIDGVLEPIGER